ncbi:13106_t:CDS:2 [Rhizophagus irregularis]|nr:13106_t:CDS:2 [Rhizophagus irregularis]
MASPYLWTPSLEPRTVINSSREVMINEAVALDKEEEDYEAQVLEDLDEDLEELDEEGDDEAEEGEESDYHYPNDVSTPILTSSSAPEEPEFLASTEILPPTSPNGDSSMNISMNISEREEFIAIDNEIYVNGSNTHEEPSFNMEE